MPRKSPKPKLFRCLKLWAFQLGWKFPLITSSAEAFNIVLAYQFLARFSSYEGQRITRCQRDSSSIPLARFLIKYAIWKKKESSVSRKPIVIGSSSSFLLQCYLLLCSLFCIQRYIWKSKSLEAKYSKLTEEFLVAHQPGAMFLWGHHFLFLSFSVHSCFLIAGSHATSTCLLFSF